MFFGDAFVRQRGLRHAASPQWTSMWQSSRRSLIGMRPELNEPCAAISRPSTRICSLSCWVHPRMGLKNNTSKKNKERSAMALASEAASSHAQQVQAATAAEPVLKVKGFSLSFSKDAPVNLVEDVSFSVGRGETLCIVGESGCGKSVTSLALMGLLPTPPARIVAGRAEFEGRDLFTMDERSREDLRGNRMAMIFQEPMTSLNPAFTIGHQI